jgi:hypothetical protein
VRFRELALTTKRLERFFQLFRKRIKHWSSSRAPSSHVVWSGIR